MKKLLLAAFVAFGSVAQPANASVILVSFTGWGPGSWFRDARDIYPATWVQTSGGFEFIVDGDDPSAQSGTGSYSSLTYPIPQTTGSFSVTDDTLFLSALLTYGGAGFDSVGLALHFDPTYAGARGLSGLAQLPIAWGSYTTDDRYLSASGLLTAFSIQVLDEVTSGTPPEFYSTIIGPQPLPEPTSWLMLLLGFGAMGFALRHCHRPNAARGCR